MQLDWLLVLMLLIILVGMIVLKHVLNLWHILLLVQVVKTQGASFHDVWKISSCCIVALVMANNGLSLKVMNLSLHHILVKDLGVWILNWNWVSFNVWLIHYFLLPHGNVVLHPCRCGTNQTCSFLQGVGSNGLLGLGVLEISMANTMARQWDTQKKISMCFDLYFSRRIIFGDKGPPEQPRFPLVSMSMSYSVVWRCLWQIDLFLFLHKWCFLYSPTYL